MQLVVFSIAGEEYGIPVDYVDEIIRFSDPTLLPKTPPSVLGIINLRNQVIPIVSFRRLFGFPEGEVTNSTRIIVSEIGDQTIGFVVDSVSEVLDVEEKTIEPYSGDDYGVDSDFISGIAKLTERLIIILNLERIRGYQRCVAV